MTTYRNDDDEQPVPDNDFMTGETADEDDTVDNHEVPLGAAIDYLERERGELPDDALD